jgi:pSer/pThr/pTyr-binding forkhead associated (FHA) protein
MADIPVLVCTGGALQGGRFKVPETGTLRMGRSDENDVVIVDDGVSRFHAELMYQNGALWLSDSGSRNGVFVNGVRVTAHQQLKVGDEIAVADHRFSVRWDEPDEEVATEEMAGVGERKAGRRKWFWPFS